ncbi:MAG: methyltransferase domain-containing protein [Rhodothermaceae bacterium]|nr:methyltransferase domain-containing protein [Rhodothermaceae bacterium]
MTAFPLQHLVAFLRCPDCEQRFTLQPIPQRDAEVGECGLLRCACFAYPVLDGVPVLTKERLPHRSIADDRVVADGPLPGDLAALVEEGRALEGLVDLLTFPVCPWPLNRVGALRRLSLRGPHHALGLAYRKRRVRRMLARRDALTAEDWLDAFYWHAPAPFDPFNYFFLRFGQPRHLATLGLLSILPPAEAPLLDLACGYGHFLHAVTSGGQPAVGLDQNFHQMWVARHYVAPGAAFVCADAARPLPFCEGVFSSALCADAFQHLYDKAGVYAELDRCVGNGPILLASVINRLADPSDGEALTPDGYAALLSGRRCRVRTGSDLLARYLGGLGPDLRTSSEPDAVAAGKWLYYVAAKDEALFRDHGALEAWPHAAGAVQVNPIYDVDGERLTFRFPSPWYASENGAMRDYMPASASLQGDRPALLARGVLVGLPERYARRAGRPWTFGANRALSDLVHLYRM